jgi:hypothetical protein
MHPGHKQKLGRFLQDIGFHANTIQVTQKRLPRDKVSRIEFCNAMLRIISEDRDVLNLLLMSGEAHFHVAVFVNKQNMRRWHP